MIVNLDRFNFDNVLTEILAECNKQHKTGYFEVNYISDKKYAYFKRIYLKGITEEEIKDDIAEIYRDFLRS